MLGIVELELGGSILDDLPPSLAEALIRHMPGGYSQKNESALESYIKLLQICSKTKQEFTFDKALLLHAMRTELRDVSCDLKSGEITKEEAVKRLEVIADSLGTSEAAKKAKLKLEEMIWRL